MIETMIINFHLCFKLGEYMKFLFLLFFMIPSLTFAVTLNNFSVGEKIEAQKINENFGKILVNDDGTEQLTKRVWFGSPVYKKCFSENGAVVNNQILGSIGTFDSIVEFSGSFRISTTGTHYGIPHSIGSSFYFVPLISSGGSVEAAVDGWSVDQVRLCIEFTKI